MSVKEWIIQRVSQRPPDFKIGSAGNYYMLRWYLIPRNRFFNIYIHHFLRSDQDFALHDHPWSNASWLLRGAYTEHTIAAGGVHHKRIFTAGDVKMRLSGKHAHRIELHAGDCWSCFVTGPVYREWGFLCKSGWVPFRVATRRTEDGSDNLQGCGDDVEVRPIQRGRL